jgi:formylglycine-generating enzyme required for sulfatase activity
MGSFKREIDKRINEPGNTKRADELRSELPARPVEITRPFYLGMHEVTVGEFDRFVATTGYQTDAEKNGLGRGWNVQRGAEEIYARYDWRNPGWPQRSNHPVVLVSWNDAAAYCRWKSGVEHATYRLPTEAEWEYARADGTPTFYDESTTSKFANVADLALKRVYPFPHHLDVEWINDQAPFTAPVGSYHANAYGSFDLTGNVQEWCADWFAADYRRAGRVDPVGPVAGTRRVVRGGSWKRSGVELRVTSRAGASVPTSANAETGFRVVREMAP